MEDIEIQEEAYLQGQDDNMEGWEDQEDDFVDDDDDDDDDDDEGYEDTETEFNDNNPFWVLYLQVKPRGNKESWAEDIGLPPSVLVDAWGYCAEYEDFLTTFEPIDLLRLCSWLRKHSTYRSSSAEWNTSKTTFARRVWMLLLEFNKIFGNLHSREDFAERWRQGFVNTQENQTFRFATVSVDGINCDTQGSQNNYKQRSLYSFKCQTTTIKYQLATQIDSGWIVDIAGPYVGSVHDYPILRASKLLDWLLPQEKIVCDAGYAGKDTEYFILRPFTNPKSHQKYHTSWSRHALHLPYDEPSPQKIPVSI